MERKETEHHVAVGFAASVRHWVRVKKASKLTPPESGGLIRLIPHLDAIGGLKLIESVLAWRLLGSQHVSAATALLQQECLLTYTTMVVPASARS